MEVNANNFLIWDDGAANTGQPKLPHGYRRDKGGFPYMPVAYPSETLSFYVNTESGVLISGVTLGSQLGLRIIKVTDGSTAANNVATVALHTVGAKYNPYATFVLPFLPTGAYYLQLYKKSDNSTVYTSNYIMFRNDKPKLDEETMYCRFRHDRTFYNIKYHELTGFYQQFRLHFNVLERQLDSEKESYKEVTTGKVRTLQNYLNRYYKIESYYFDDKAHTAAGIMLEHDFLELNGRQYTLKSTYKEASNSLSVYAKGEAEVWDDAFASVNRC